MAYTKEGLMASKKYKKEKYQRIEFGYTKALWNEHLSPAIQASGLSQSAFIRIALIEKILNDKLYKEGDEAFLKELLQKYSRQGAADE